MGLFVGLEDGGAGEGLPAEAAREGPLPRVHPGVILHVVPELEGLPAVIAPEGPVLRHGRRGEEACHHHQSHRSSWRRRMEWRRERSPQRLPDKKETGQSSSVLLLLPLFFFSQSVSRRESATEGTNPQKRSF